MNFTYIQTEIAFREDTPMYRGQRSLTQSLDLAWIDYRHRTPHREEALAWLETNMVIFRAMKDVPTDTTSWSVTAGRK